jgi:hypothetical protein
MGAGDLRVGGAAGRGGVRHRRVLARRDVPNRKIVDRQEPRWPIVADDFDGGRLRLVAPAVERKSPEPHVVLVVHESC